MGDSGTRPGDARGGTREARPKGVMGRRERKEKDDWEILTRKVVPRLDNWITGQLDGFC